MDQIKFLSRLAAAGIGSTRKAAVMLAIERARKPLPISAIRAKTGIAPAAMTSIGDQMEGAGLAWRTPNDDRRSCSLGLTDRGLELLREARK